MLPAGRIHQVCILENPLVSRMVIIQLVVVHVCLSAIQVFFFFFWGGGFSCCGFEGATQLP